MTQPQDLSCPGFEDEEEHQPDAEGSLESLMRAVKQIMLNPLKETQPADISVVEQRNSFQNSNLHNCTE